jgi:hypothetical protein
MAAGNQPIEFSNPAWSCEEESLSLLIFTGGDR